MVIINEAIHKSILSNFRGSRIYFNIFISKKTTICCLGYEVVLLLVTEFMLKQPSPAVMVIMNEAFHKSIQSTCLGLIIYINIFISKKAGISCLGYEVVLFSVTEFGSCNRHQLRRS